MLSMRKEGEHGLPLESDFDESGLRPVVDSNRIPVAPLRLESHRSLFRLGSGVRKFIGDRMLGDARPRLASVRQYSSIPDSGLATRQCN